MKLDYNFNYLEYDSEDYVNGTGIRVSLFVTGCTHRCKGCFNPETWDADNGVPFTTETRDKIFEDVAREDIHISGISLLGGEPFENLGLIKFMREFRDRFPDKDIWVWSGYTLQQIVECDEKVEMLKLTDILIDGKFVEDKKDDELRFRGSTNQIIYNKRDINFIIKKFRGE